MPTLMPKDTADVLGPNAEECESRSLFMDRFACPGDKEEHRKKWFESLARKSPESIVRGPFISENTTPPLYAQLQSRLMVNMAGGVMENAGLCLDRFGLPYIPGSAVKGCARRAALAALHEWCTSGTKPGSGEDGQDNLFTAACVPFEEPAEMLAAIARVFGWGEQDWSDKTAKDGRYISDFAWACEPDVSEQTAASEARTARDSSAQDNTLVSGAGSETGPAGSPQNAAAFNWVTIRLSVVDRLARALRISFQDDDQSPWKRLGAFAGSVSFLPAHPIDLGKTGRLDGLTLDLPPLGKLELDVVTCHHPDYYSKKKDHATDTEDPNPVVFPAVAPGHVFAFALAKLRHGQGDDLNLIHARAWLAAGLSVFGLGAKTNAGYGWFDVSDAMQQSIRACLKQKEANEVAERERVIQKEADVKAEQERLVKKRELEQKKASMTPEENEDFDLDEMNPDQRLQWIEKIDKRNDAQKQAIYRLLQSRDPDLWRQLRDKVEKGKQKEKKRFGFLVHEMFRMAKERKEKMPK